MRRGRALQPAVTCLLCAAAAAGCNSVFDITEGTPRAPGAAGLANPTGGSGNGAAGGTNGVPKGGTTSKGGASSSGAAGLAAGSQSLGGSRANGGSGGSGENGGTGATEGGTDPGTLENGGTGAHGGSTSGAAGAGGSTGGSGAMGGSDAGMGGMAGQQGPTNIVSGRDFLIWPKCDADNSGFETTCPFYGAQGPSACSDPNLAFEQRGAFLKETIPIGGVNGTTYHVQVRVSGAAATRCYQGGELAPVNTVSGTQNVYVGGTPTDSAWTSFELHVYDAESNPTGVYYLNAAPAPPSTQVLCETYSTQQLFNNVTLDLPGNGYVQTVVHDTDCVMDTNCEGGKAFCAPIGPSTLGNQDQLPPEFEPVDTAAGERTVPVDHRYGEVNTAQYSQYMYVDVQDITSDSN